MTTTTLTMKVQNMSEPITGAAAGAAGFKALGGAAGAGAIGASLAALVVMSKTRPKNDREWVVALVSTLVSSIAGCAWVVVYFKLQQQMMQDAFGLVALGGLFFACGLPGWVIVRAMFNYTEKRKGAGLDEIVKDVKGMM